MPPHASLGSDAAQQRLEASRSELAPWIDADTHLVAADRWLDDGETRLRVGGVDLVIRHVGSAHTGEDLVVLVPRPAIWKRSTTPVRGPTGRASTSCRCFARPTA